MQLRGCTLSSQLLGFKWADSTQISLHLTAVQHAFPFLFLTRTPILGCQIQAVSRLLSPKLYMCLGLHVPGGVLGSVCLCDCVSTCLYMSMLQVSSHTHLPDSIGRALVYVLPQIMSDVTSLRTVYMCEIQRWLSSLY